MSGLRRGTSLLLRFLGKSACLSSRESLGVLSWRRSRFLRSGALHSVVCVCVCLAWFDRRPLLFAFVEERSCEGSCVLAFLGEIVVVRATVGSAWVVERF